MEDLYRINKHYIRVDERGCIVNGFSDAFKHPNEGDICINEHGSYQFRLYDDGDENPALSDEHGILLYVWDNGTVKKRTQEEIQSEIDALPEPAISKIDQITETVNLISETIADILGGAYE